MGSLFGWLTTPDYIESMKLRRLSERLGCLSLRTPWLSLRL